MVLAEREAVRLGVEGMSCAACAARIERALNELDGVEATVNFATGTAAVSFDPQRVAQEQLIGAVERTGYAAHPASRGEHERPRKLGCLTLPCRVAGRRRSGWGEVISAN